MFGLGLRHPHHLHVLENRPEVDFFEVHTENFICEGGASLNLLNNISKNYKLSFHCVGLSFGSASGLDKVHLKNIKNLVDRFNPFLLSDHLSWSSAETGVSNDLLPVPYTNEALGVFCDNINQAQDFFGRSILIENPSAYLEYSTSEMSEVDFLNEIASKTNCDILLDINNVYVSSQNFDFDPIQYLNNINYNKVKQVHLAGHSTYKYQNREVKIDTHSTNISPQVLDLYKYFTSQVKKQIPVLVEWDEDIPHFDILYNELQKVKSVLL